MNSGDVSPRILSIDDDGSNLEITIGYPTSVSIDLRSELFTSSFIQNLSIIPGLSQLLGIGNFNFFMK